MGVVSPIPGVTGFIKFPNPVWFYGYLQYMPQKETLLITINSLRSGGAERVVSQLLWSLSKEFEIHLAVYSPIIEFEIPSEVKIFDMNQSEEEGAVKMLFKLPAMAKRLAKYCKEHNIRYSIAFLNRPCYLHALMRKFYGYNGRLVMCERTHQTGMLSTKSRLTRFMTRLLIPIAYNTADLVLANAEAMKQDLIKTMHVRKPIAVIYNPINIPIIEKKVKEPVNFTKEPGVFYFIAVGNFRKEKNFPLLIEAFNRMKNKTCNLILVGNGPDMKRIEALLAGAGTTQRVIFTGMQRNPYKWMGLADAFVLPSDVEGFPNVLLEALALGLPAIATDCYCGPREMIAPQNGETGSLKGHYQEVEYGILTPVGSPETLAVAMDRMVSDIKLRERLIERSRNRAIAFALPEVALLYEEAFSGRGSFQNKEC